AVLVSRHLPTADGGACGAANFRKAGADWMRGAFGDSGAGDARLSAGLHAKGAADRGWCAGAHDASRASTLRQLAGRCNDRETAVAPRNFSLHRQTLLRVPRYRIYLVLYGGVGLSVVIATILRLSVVDGVVRAEISADGM